MENFGPKDKRLTFENEMQQYNCRVMTRNWADERLQFERVYSPNYTSITKKDFVSHGTPKTGIEARTQIIRKMEGRPHDYLFRHAGKLYQKNNITTYDQDFNQLPKLQIDGVKKRYLKPWQLEQQLEETNFVLTTEPPKDDTTGRAPGYCSETVYSYRPPPPEALLKDHQRYAVLRDMSVDYFKPNLSARGYPAFVVPEYTGTPPQLHKAQPVTKDLAWKPVLSTRLYEPLPWKPKHFTKPDTTLVQEPELSPKSHTPLVQKPELSLTSLVSKQPEFSTRVYRPIPWNPEFYSRSNKPDISSKSYNAVETQTQNIN